MPVFDDTSNIEGLNHLFEDVGKAKNKTGKKVGHNSFGNPQRALELSPKICGAALTKTQETITFSEEDDTKSKCFIKNTKHYPIY